MFTVVQVQHLAGCGGVDMKGEGGRKGGKEGRYKREEKEANEANT